MVGLKQGGYYKTRDGRKMGPVEFDGLHIIAVVEGEAVPQGYRPNGKWGCDETFGNADKDLDIVSEWSEAKPANPKKRYGDKKPALAQLPLAGMAAQSLAQMDGDYKYGFRNWRDDPVEAITYVNAALRHLMLWAEGEEDARDTGVPNLGGVMACCAILLDAQANGTLIDNRSKSPGACDILHDYEEKVARLREMALDREANRD